MIFSGVENQKKWYENAVIYQIYPRSFKDSDGDGIGDLEGIRSNLWHIKDIGCKAIWLNPIFKSPMVDLGYDISDFHHIQPEFGTMKDSKFLVEDAHEREIKIILDLVPNHSSNLSVCFSESVLRDPYFEGFYFWDDGIIDENGNHLPPNNWKSLLGGSAWEWNEIRGQFYYHILSREQVDINYRDANALKGMDQVINYWLEKDFDGFHISSASYLFEDEYLRNEPLKEITNAPLSYDSLDHIYTKNLPENYDLIYHWREIFDNFSKNGSHRIFMAETNSNYSVMAKYYENEKTKQQGVHFPFNFLFIKKLNNTSNAENFVFEIQNYLKFVPKGHTPNWILGNHNVPRVASRYGKEYVDILNMLIMILKGTVITYFGEEIGMTDYDGISWSETIDPRALRLGPQNYQKKSRDPSRTPFQWGKTKNAGFSNATKTWLPVNTNYKTLNLCKQKKFKKSHYKLYKRMVQIKMKPTIELGSMILKTLSEFVFAVKRSLQDYPTIITVINVGPYEETVDLRQIEKSSQMLTVIAAVTTSLYNEGDILECGYIEIGPYDGICLEIETI